MARFGRDDPVARVDDAARRRQRDRARDVLQRDHSVRSGRTDELELIIRLSSTPPAVSSTTSAIHLVARFLNSLTPRGVIEQVYAGSRGGAQ